MATISESTSHKLKMDFMQDGPLFALSPVDGRYKASTAPLREYFSELALFKYRVQVEVLYLTALYRKVPEVKALFDSGNLNEERLNELKKVTYENFTEEDGKRIKEIEKVTNHDIKAVEYYLKEKIDTLLSPHNANHPDKEKMEKITENIKEYIHFGLTSQDINNTSIPMLVRDAVVNIILPRLDSTVELLDSKRRMEGWDTIPMLARTHGQPASPTTMGKEMHVFLERIEEQKRQLHAILSPDHWSGKFGGATGNMNAHRLAYPAHNWLQIAKEFLAEDLKLKRQQYTTQIEHYDNMAALFDVLARMNRIWVDFARDVWQYISVGYFTQRTKEGEVGSSTMPHKVNPIDFENAEGNLLLANALLHFLSEKLPISRLQRDLTDSTVLRNIGVPLGHVCIAFSSLQRGLAKLELHQSTLANDLDNNWAVITEGIQTVLRREGFPRPYEALKDLTRGHQEHINKASIEAFIEGLFKENKITAAVKEELLRVNPFNYVGYTETTTEGNAEVRKYEKRLKTTKQFKKKN